MKKLLRICTLLTLAVILQQRAWAAIDTAEAYSQLTKIGFENLKIAQQGNVTYVTLEDNVYRGNYRGFSVALQALSPSVAEDAASDTIVLVALENKMPKVTLTAIHDNANLWHVKANYGESAKAAKTLCRTKSKESSLGKIDFVIHPELMIDSLFHDNNGKFAIGIAPAIEVALWKGAKLTAQVIIPIYNNLDNTDMYDHVRPGVMTLSQNFSNRWMDVTATAGIFRVFGALYATDRHGIDLKAMGHINHRFDLGLEVGYTGATYLDGAAWKFDAWEDLSLLGHLSYYERLINCQFDLYGGRFVYGDAGVRLDVTRRLAEYSVGCFGTYAGSETGMGFFCSIPLGTKKKFRHSAVRVSLPESMHWTYSIPNYAKAFTYERRGVMYDTKTQGNYSNEYWQPDYIAKYVEKVLNGKLK